MGTNREAWFEKAIDRLSHIFAEHGYELPKVRVSTGWPSSRGTSTKKRVLGECWKPATAQDGLSQIFISPVLDDTTQVLAVLVHELIHAWDKGESGHRGPFVAAAKDMGLVAPWTATTPGEALTARLEAIAEDIGPYPHSAITPAVQRKTQKTYMRKLEAKGCCGYIARATIKWIEEHGTPLCPHGVEMELEVKE